MSQHCQISHPSLSPNKGDSSFSSRCFPLQLEPFSFLWYFFALIFSKATYVCLQTPLILLHTLLFLLLLLLAILTAYQFFFFNLFLKSVHSYKDVLLSFSQIMISFFFSWQYVCVGYVCLCVCGWWKSFSSLLHLPFNKHKCIRFLPNLIFFHFFFHHKLL